MNYTQTFRQGWNSFQLIISKVEVCQLAEFLISKMNVIIITNDNKINKKILINVTLKAFAFTPLVLSWLWLTLRDTSFVGNIGSFTSLFSAIDSSSSWVSFEKAPSSISEIRLPDRSILLSVTGNTIWKCKNMRCKHIYISSLAYSNVVPSFTNFIKIDKQRCFRISSQNRRLLQTFVGFSFQSWKIKLNIAFIKSGSSSRHYTLDFLCHTYNGFPSIPHQYHQSPCWLFLWFCWSVHRDKQFPLVEVELLSCLGTPPRNIPIRWDIHTSNKWEVLKIELNMVKWLQIQVVFMLN